VWGAGRAPPAAFAVAPAAPGDLQAAVTAALEQHEAGKRSRRAEAPPLIQTPELAAAVAVVDAAIATHVWSDQHVDRLKAVLSKLDAVQRAEVVDKLGAAINSGQLHVETEEGAPL
jgi:hypothetical protein